jgi:large subunit ribosomal protein L27
VKLYDGQVAQVGSVLVRQTGSSFWPGEGVRQGSDYTLYATTAGTVKFQTRKKTNYDGRRHTVKIVHIVPTSPN